VTTTDQALPAGPLFDIPLTRLNGEPDSMANYRGNVLLVVNVASKCGRTPQYAALQQLFERYQDQGFTVLGFPCNQFGDEEPGSAEEIAVFCQQNYGVTFPMFAKLEVNGPARHPVYEILASRADDSGEAGDIAWNFEKFVIGRDGTSIRRFRHTITPDEPEVVAAIEGMLAV
jgi:glutathione peroxidase